MTENLVRIINSESQALTELYEKALVQQGYSVTVQGTSRPHAGEDLQSQGRALNSHDEFQVLNFEGPDGKKGHYEISFSETHNGYGELVPLGLRVQKSADFDPLEGQKIELPNPAENF